MRQTTASAPEQASSTPALGFHFMRSGRARAVGRLARTNREFPRHLSCVVSCATKSPRGGSSTAGSKSCWACNTRDHVCLDPRRLEAAVSTSVKGVRHEGLRVPERRALSRHRRGHHGVDEFPGGYRSRSLPDDVGDNRPSPQRPTCAAVDSSCLEASLLWSLSNSLGSTAALHRPSCLSGDPWPDRRRTRRHSLRTESRWVRSG